MIAVVGPTASGKSELAMALAEGLGGEVINTDAMQVYRHLDIGTAKPSMEDRQRVPHHLINLVEPDEHYSAGRYVKDAQRVIGNLAARERVPVLCGGTGLYFRALLFGLAAIPPVSAEVRRAVEARLSERGAPACHAELGRADPEAAAAIHPNDSARIARALSVLEATGVPISTYRRERPFRANAPHVLSLGLHFERAELYERIDRRVRAMLADGWIDEVRGLLAMGYSPQIKPLQAIGYREIIFHLQEGGDSETLAEAIARRTRQYAKRQLTWFRKHPDIIWESPERMADLMVQAKKFLLSGHPGR